MTKDNIEEATKALGISFNAYQNLARKTRLPTADAEYCAMNLGSEAGEVLGLIAKARRKQVPVDMSELSKELGDELRQVSAVEDD